MTLALASSVYADAPRADTRCAHAPCIALRSCSASQARTCELLLPWQHECIPLLDVFLSFPAGLAYGLPESYALAFFFPPPSDRAAGAIGTCGCRLRSGSSEPANGCPSCSCGRLDEPPSLRRLAIIGNAPSCGIDGMSLLWRVPFAGGAGSTLGVPHMRPCGI